MKESVLSGSTQFLLDLMFAHTFKSSGGFKSQQCQQLPIGPPKNWPGSPNDRTKQVKDPFLHSFYAFHFKKPLKFYPTVSCLQGPFLKSATEVVLYRSEIFTSHLFSHSKQSAGK